MKEAEEMEIRETKTLNLLADWLCVWGLLSCTEREFFYNYSGCPKEEDWEQLRQRVEEIRETLEECQETELLQLKDLSKGGGYADILRGLSSIAAQIGSGEERTEKKWREIEMLIIKLKIHAWAQKMKAYICVRSDAKEA